MEFYLRAGFSVTCEVCLRLRIVFIHLARTGPSRAVPGPAMPRCGDIQSYGPAVSIPVMSAIELTSGRGLGHGRVHGFYLRMLLLAGLLVFAPVWALGASWSTPPADVNAERVYRAHAVEDMIPLVIIAGVVVVGWLMARSQRRASRRA